MKEASETVRAKKAEAASRPLRVAMVAAEVVPFSKVGGLADVMGALPAALAGQGMDVTVIAPRYPAVEPAGLEVRRAEARPTLAVPGPWDETEAEVWEASGGPGVKVFLLGAPAYFDREGVYSDPATGLGYPDNAERYFFFSRAVFELLRGSGPAPDVIHLHDNHPAPLALLLRGPGARPGALAPSGLVFTIHNLGYQGVYPREEVLALGSPPETLEVGGCLEFYGQANLMKAALVLCDRITTVSPRYAREIQEGPEFGFGLEGVLHDRREHVSGILNGVDYSIWNPARDVHLPRAYDRDHPAGKSEARRALRREVGLPEERGRRSPLVGMISRLADQKGFDLVAEVGPELMQRGLQLVVLGSGEPRYHQMLEDLVKAYPQRIAVHFGFNDRLAHLIEGGADLFLMPSRYEPCGLNQIYSLRYGTIPVVRATGGLADTVVDCDARPREGTGFVFEEYEGAALLEALDRALAAYADSRRWRSIMRRAMAADFGWERSAESYGRLYRSLVAERSAVTVPRPRERETVSIAEQSG